MLSEAKDLRCEPWRDGSGTIIGWRSKGKDGQPAAPNRLLVFHGNAGYALNRAHYIRGFERLVDGQQWEVTLFEFPGYGARPGSVGEKSFLKAGGEALHALEAEDARPVYLLGESLGSGLACSLAQKAPNQIAGVFLVTPFARIADVASIHFWYLPVRLLLRESWDNMKALATYDGRLAVLIAEQDEVVTAAQGKLLFGDFRGPKRLWTDADATHNSVDFSAGAQWWQEVSEFLLSNSRNAK